MVPPASLCSATARADAADGNAKRESPNTSYEANRCNSLPKLRKRFLFRGSADAAARNCKVNSCRTMRQLMERLHSKGMIRAEPTMRLRRRGSAPQKLARGRQAHSRKRKPEHKTQGKPTLVSAKTAEALSISSFATSGPAIGCKVNHAQSYGY